MEDEDHRSMFWLATAGVVLFLIVGLGVWLAVTRPGGDVRAGAQDAPLSAPRSGGCDVADGPQTLAAPDDVTWQLYGLEALPYSATAGPLVTEGVVARCYAHSPGGALLASIQIPARISLSGNVKWENVATAQLPPGPGRDALMRRVRDSIAAAPTGQPGQAPGQVAAFQIVSYTPAAAVVATVYRGDGGALGVSSISLVWESGDWKVSVLPTGDLGPPAAAVPSIAGYTEFRGA